jgi:hypothetical protein
MSIQLNKPFKIISSRQKRYEEHYQIPAADALVIPTKNLGAEALCEVRWLDSAGEMHAKSNVMFSHENLATLNGLEDERFYDIWNRYDKSISVL